MVAKRVFYAGRVQGVGFRYGTRQIAKGFEVTGTVRNLADGRVELYVRGDPEEVAEFLSEIRERSNLAHHILAHEEEEILASVLDAEKGFRIIR
jgi:acylphosphatase